MATYEADICTGSFYSPVIFRNHCNQTRESIIITYRLEKSGLLTFLNLPIIGFCCYINLITFWQTSKVADDKITARVNGIDVVITPNVLHQVLNFPNEGVTEVNDVEFPKCTFWSQIVADPSTPIQLGGAKELLKPPYNALAMLIHKIIEGKLGSSDALTPHRCKVMYIILNNIKFNWAQYFYNRLAEQIQTEINEKERANKKKASGKRFHVKKPLLVISSATEAFNGSRSINTRNKIVDLFYKGVCRTYLLDLKIQVKNYNRKNRRWCEEHRDLPHV